MANKFDNTFTTMASRMQSAPSGQEYARRLLLGYGQSGKFLMHSKPRVYVRTSSNQFSVSYLQVFGTTELPEKPIMLPPFVDSTHCLPYYLTRKGRAVADRVVSVLAYVCPDITYSPTIYPIAAILLHFMSGKL